jgi:hypothetical protein
MGEVGKHGRAQPVHVFTVRYADGTTRRKAIPGEYSASGPARLGLQARLPADATILEQTWRPDYSAIDKPANSQPDYGHPPPVVCALLAYYDEHPTWLRQLVESLPMAGVTRLVAADGAYALYPNARTKSAGDCQAALQDACDRSGIQLFHHTPDELWEDELHKRSFLFEYGETATQDHDWYFVVDADERVTQAPHDLPSVLDRIGTLVAEATLWDSKSHIPLRMFFRAKRGLKVVGNHYTYQLPDGRRLWGNWNDNLELATPVPVLVEHRDENRPAARIRAKFEYYDVRDREKPEAHACSWCDRPATRSIPWNWRWSGPGIVGERAGACETCAPARLDESIAAAAELGVDASHLRGTQRAFR